MINSECWRRTSAKETFELIGNHKERFGLERIVDITSLDITGIPVYLCIRPRGKLMSLSAGKGLNAIDSIVSAAMESIEIDVAERIPLNSYQSLSYESLPIERRCEIEKISFISSAHLSPKTPIDWVEGYEIGSNTCKLLPLELVSMDLETHVGNLNRFAFGTNGLASSIYHDEAVLSGLYEVIERDTIACWSAYRLKYPKATQFAVDIESIPFEKTSQLIDKISSSGLQIFILQLKNELDIPVFKCHILNNIDQGRATASGYGCHHNVEIALNRAITEAAQGRNCYIAGSREDMLKSRYKAIDYGYASNYFSQLNIEPVDTPSGDCIITINQAILDITNKFKERHWSMPIVYTYPNAHPFSVVKVVCPDLMPTSFSGMTLSHPRSSAFLAPKTKYQSFIEILNSFSD